MNKKMEYEKKFTEMQEYIPFLENMIKRLESTQSLNPREAQLTKIKALRNLLLDTNKRMKMENLLKCEQVLLNLYSKVGEADLITPSPIPTPAMEIKEEVIEHEELAVNLQSVREKLKIVSGVTDKEMEPKPPSVHSPAAHIVDNKNTGTTSNMQVRSEIRVPQLFERRPKKISTPTTDSPQQQRGVATDHSPPSAKSQRKYTRVLCSPENDSRRWDSSEKQITPHKTPYDSHDVQLFQRRSPRRRKSSSHSPRSKSGRKKSHKKDRQSSTRSGRPSSNCSYEDVNITLNVPEESLNSLSASDIFDRIVNCNENDVDIKHLRELRSQIVKELKHTGANQDISDYILKSYKKKKKKKPKVKEVEEGELSDSESESLQKIYGNLIVEVKNEGDVEEVGQEPINTTRPIALSTKPLVEKEQRKDSPKIKISLIISNPGDEDLADTSLPGASSKPTTTFLLDIANTETGVKTVKADSENNAELDVGANKSSKTNVSPFFYGELQIDEGASKEIALNSVEDASTKHNLNPVSIADNKIKVMNYFSAKCTADKDIRNFKEQSKSDNKFDNTLHTESTHSHTLKHVANSIEAVSKPKEFYMSTSNAKADKGLSDLLYKDLSPTTSPSTSDDKPAQKTAAKDPEINKRGNVNDPNPSSFDSEENKLSKHNHQEIPFLSEAAPNIEKKNTSDVISEIDILKALKNEILGEAIDIPKASLETPSLHQPKISKVTDKSQLDADNKKRISLEKYKQKVGPAQKGIFARQAEKEQAKLLSRALTPRECERFQMILKNTMRDDDISDDESPIEQLSESSLRKLDNKDMGPKSPEEDNFSDSVGGSPVLIPSDPVHSDDHEHTSSTHLAKKDVDMRVQMSSTQMTKASPLISPQPSVSAKHSTSSVTNVAAQPTQFNESQRPKGMINSSNNYNSEFPGSANYNSRNPSPFIGHHMEPLRSTPPSIPQLMGTSIMHPSMTPQHFSPMTTTRGPAMTPSRCPPMTSSRVLMTPTYSPMCTDENMPVRRHVYAPSDLPDPTRTPTWDMVSSPVIRDDGSSTPVWDNTEPRNTSMIRDNNFPPVWDNLGGRSPMITENPQEFGFCTPRHDPFNRIAEYNRPVDQNRANNLDTNYLNRNRAARDPRLTTERKDDGFQRDPRMTNYSLGSRGDTSVDPRTNRDSRQCGPGQFFEDESNRPFQHIDNRKIPEASLNRQFSNEQRMGREYTNELNVPHSFNNSVRPFTRENSIGPGVQYNGESNMRRHFNRASSVGRSFGRESSVGRSVGRESSVGRNIGHEYSFDRNMGREPSVGRSMGHEPSVGLYIGRHQSVANISNMGRAQSVGRNLGREPSVGRNRDREQSVGPNVAREHTYGHNMGRERSIGHNIDGEPSVGRNMCREESVGRNMGYDQSVGRYMGREACVGHNMGREQSVGRSMGREASVGRNMGREASVGRSMGLEANIGRNMGREASVGRNMGREASVGRSMGREASVGRNMGYEPIVGRNMGREASVGRSMGREASVGRNMGYEPIVGRNMGREASVGRNMRREDNVGRNMGRESSVERNIGREPSVGRSSGREPSVGRNVGRERSIGRHMSREPSVGRDIGREKSVGRHMSRESSVGRNIDREPSMGRNSSCSKNIPCGKTESRKSRKSLSRANHNRERDSYRNSDEILTGRRENLSTSSTQRGRSNRTKVQVLRTNSDLRSRSASISSNSSSSRSVSINTKEKHDFSNSKDPRNPGNRTRDRTRDERTKDRRTHDDDHNKRTGIVYTSDNIAKGKLMGQGYGVKNYKIPKIKRPVDEAMKNEVAKIIEKGDTPKVETKSSKKVIVSKDEKLKDVPCDSTQNVSGRNKKRKATSKKQGKSDVKTPEKPNKVTPKVEVPKGVDKKTADIPSGSPNVQSENSSEFDELLSKINETQVEVSTDTDESIQDLEPSAKVIPKEISKDLLHILSASSNGTTEVLAKVVPEEISKHPLHTLSIISSETPEVSAKEILKDSLHTLSTESSESSEVSAKFIPEDISKPSLHTLSTISSEMPEVSAKVISKEISKDSHTLSTLSSETPAVTVNTISKEPRDTLLSASTDIPPIGLQQNKDIVDTKVDSTSPNVDPKPCAIQNKTLDETSNDQAKLVDREIFYSKPTIINDNQTLPINKSRNTQAVGDTTEQVIAVCDKNIDSNSEDALSANNFMSNKLTSVEPVIAPILKDQTSGLIFTNTQTTVLPENLARSLESIKTDSLTSISSSINKEYNSELHPDDGSTDNTEAIPIPVARNTSLGMSPKKATVTGSTESAENIQTNVINISKEPCVDDIESKKLDSPTEQSDKIGNLKDADMLKPGLENIRKEEYNNKLASAPDSTIQIEGTEETTHDSVLPDSTNNSEINADASSVVSSSHDVSKDEEKEATEITNTKDKGNELDALKSLGSILSMLQDKNKMKKILTLLSDDTVETEKLKRRLTKLSEIESEDEDAAEADPSRSSPNPIVTQRLMKSPISAIEPPTGLELASTSEEVATPSEPATSLEISLSRPTENRELAHVFQQASPRRDSTQESSVTQQLSGELEAVGQEQISSSEKIDSSEQQEHTEQETEQISHLPIATSKYPKIKKTKVQPKSRKGRYKKNKNRPIKSAVNDKRITRSGSAQVPKKSKNRELQKLHEDIRDMFISQGVLSATGIRMCRLAKLTDDKSDPTRSESEDRQELPPKPISKKDTKDASGTPKKDGFALKDPKPLVVLEKTPLVHIDAALKTNENISQDQHPEPKIRKKPGPKPRPKVVGDSPTITEKTEQKKLIAKPGPKSKKKILNKTQNSNEFENVNVDSSLKTKVLPLDKSFDSDDESLSSLVSANSCDINNEPKPKQKRKYMWQHGCIKTKKKKNNKDTFVKNMSPTDYNVARPHNCFIDKKYCFEENTSKYLCRLCDYEGENIVLHFKQSHPHQEVPLSRINPKTASAAIQQSLNTDFDKFHKKATTIICRFCFQVFEGTKLHLEKFFWHVVSKHTGEYKYTCSECTDEAKCPTSLDIPTPPSEIQPLLLGYICGECHYTQISLNNLKTHVALRHDNEETEVYTINLCDVPPSAGAAKVRVSANRGKCNKTPEESKSVRQLRPRRDVSLSESVGNLSSKSTVPGDPKPVKSPVKKQPKGIGFQLTFEGDSNDGNSQYDLLESGSETIKSEREDPDLPEYESNFESHLEGLSSRRSSAASDTAIVWENAEFLESLRQAQKIKKERAEEVTETTEESDKFIEYDKNPHFMISASKEGVKSARSYVCRVKGCGSGYRTTLLISLKKHVQFKHFAWRDVWDGYCCLCKQVVNEILSKSSQSFTDCLNHMLMNHLDEFPVLQEPIITEVVTGVTSTLENDPTTVTSRKETADPQRSADTPAPKTYINVRPLSDMISKEPVAAQECTTGQKPEASVPRIQNVVSLQDTSEVAGAAPTTDVVEERGAGASGSIEPTPNECVPRDPNTMEPLTSPVDAMNIVMAQKHTVARKNMLAKSRLACVFKCAGRYCSFGARAANVFVVHLNAHLKLKTRNQSDVLRCAYCEWSGAGGGADAVAAHVWRQHGHCRYSCAHCWYLASSPTLVELHRARAHASLPPAAPLELEPPSAGESAAARDALVRSDAVLQYTCSKRSGEERCVFRGYTAPKFREHLELRHANDASFPCHICSAQFARPSGLLAHLKQHGMCLFQCTYCLCGTDTELEMLEHASKYHPSCRPQAYLRHIVETKDSSSPGSDTKKFKVLPLVQLGTQAQQQEVCPQEPPKADQLDCPTKEAERAHALERLFLTQQGDPTASPILDTDDIETQILANVISDSDDREINVAAPTAEATQPTVVEHPAPKSPDRPLEETVKIVKQEYQYAKIPKINEQRKKTSDEYIICLDSDEDEEPASIEKPAGTKVASEGQKSIKEGVSPPGDVVNLSDDEPPASSDRLLRHRSEVRYGPDQLFKCQKCNLICKNDHYYRQHLPKCYPDQNDCPRCPFCPATAASRKDIRIHLIQAHGPIKTYRCSVCGHEDTISKKIIHHMRMEHLIENVSICPELSNIDKAYTLFVVKPEDLRSGLRPAAAPAPKPSATPPKAAAKPGPKSRGKPGPKSRQSDPNPKQMLRFGPEDMDRLPLNPILDEFIGCARCEFDTKVRSNMLRHLQMHASELAVPSAAPVNPVPHLESNEMHFDKMTNLAASSNVRSTERAPPATTSAVPLAPEEAAKYPRYIPDKERNACGAVGCSYISLDETLLKYHWETLHSGLTHGPQATTYSCVHCPPHQKADAVHPLTASRVVGHLKMHDARLYGCGNCSYYHYSHSMVDKHVAEKHGSNARGVVTIRDLTEAKTAAPASASTADPRTAPTMDLKPWQCGVCKFKSMLRPEVAEHCARAHGFKFQFKCSFCPYSGSVYTSVARHQSERHTGRSAPDVIHVYYKERSLPADEEASPLWTKQRQYLNSLGDNIKAENVETSKSASAADTPPPVVDLALVKSEVEETPQAPPSSSEAAVARYGELGEPRGERYLCPLCKVTTEESSDKFINHLHEELNYRKWSCRMCSYRTFSSCRMMEHGLREHNQTLEPLELPHDVEIELWIEKVLAHQKKIIDAAEEAKKASSDAQAQMKQAQMKQTQMKQAQMKQTPTSTSKMIEGPSSNVLQELERMFGPIAASGGDKFTCPKCEFKTEDESKMTEHLEMELAKVRWSCDRCPEKFQSYHEAQRHCSSSQHTEYARVIGVSKDPKERTQWIECVIRAQSGAPPAPAADLPLAADGDESAESGGEAEGNNSLLVVRYEEDVPGPVDSRKLQPSRKRKPTCLREDDSDEEPRLVIADGARLHTCSFCDHTTSSLPSLRLHVLRHYNMRPYTCGYCDFTGHKKSIDRHLDKQHHGLAAKWINNKVPDNAPPIVRALSSSRKVAPKASRKEKAEHSAAASASPASAATSSAAASTAATPSPAAAKTTPASEETCYVCLLCDAELSALSATSHHTKLHTVHPAQQQQIVVRGALVRKCGACTELRTDADTFKRHHDAAHPCTEPAYTMVRAGHDAKEAASFVCDHCGRMFTYLRDLKCHHSAAHVSLQFLYSKKMRAPPSTPVLPQASSKRKRSGSETSPSVKRLAKKSTTKLPFALKAVARKSTSKLPYSDPVIELDDSSSEEEEAYSFYGTRPAPLRSYGHVQTRMPFYNTMMPVSVEKLSGIVNIEPVVTVANLDTLPKRLSASKKAANAR